MRTTDDPNPPPMRPLGERVTPKTSPPKSEPKPNERGIVTGGDGRMRTQIPENEGRS